MRPNAGDNREVDDFVRKHGVFGFKLVMKLCSRGFVVNVKITSKSR